jgi:hypothetical protein
MFFRQFLGSAVALAALASGVELKGYEYVVVGSGAGGGVSDKIRTYCKGSTDVKSSLSLPALRSLATRPS